MTPTQATDLALLCSQRWPNGLNTQLWEEDLLPLSYPRARRAYEAIKHTVRFPGQAPVEFHDKYKQLTSNAPVSNPLDRCGQCDGTGFVPVERYHGPNCGKKQNRVCTCSAVAPCRCSEGDARRRSSSWKQAAGVEIDDWEAA